MPEPRITHPELNLLLATASDIVGDLGWAQGENRDDDGRACLIGALQEASMNPVDHEFVYCVLAERGYTWAWNDQLDPVGGESVVRKTLWQEQITDDDLLQTFGPQWPQLIALIRHAARMTGPKSVVESATCPEARVVALAAHQQRYGESARPRVLSIFLSPDTPIAQIPVGVLQAAHDAALAISTWHLIDTTDYTLDHHDTLRNRWDWIVHKFPIA